MPLQIDGLNVASYKLVQHNIAYFHFCTHSKNAIGKNMSDWFWIQTSAVLWHMGDEPIKP